MDAANLARESHLVDVSAGPLRADLGTIVDRDVRVEQAEVERLRTAVRAQKGLLDQRFRALVAKENECAALGRRAEVLEARLRQRAEQMARLESDIQQVRERWLSADGDLGRWRAVAGMYQETLREMRSSLWWGAIRTYRGVRDRLFPFGATRRRVYDAFIESVKNSGLQVNLWNKEAVLLMETNMLWAGDHRPVSLERELAGVFTCPTGSLCGLGFLTATHIRINAAVRLTLSDVGRGRVVREVAVDGDLIKDNDYTLFSFRPLRESRGRQYRFELVSCGLPAAAIWLNEEVGDPRVELLHEGKWRAGGINLRVYARLRHPDPHLETIGRSEPTRAGRWRQRREQRELGYRPKISIVVPVYDPPPRMVEEMIESVLQQTYDNWELCITDGGSRQGAVRAVLKKSMARDERVRVCRVLDNRGIARNSNEALGLATGEFVGFLDHDDALAPSALYEVVKLLNDDPTLDLIYTDEDKISEDGRKRFDPHLKPDWSPDLLRSCNYISHFSVVRRSLLEEVGGLREEFEGAQDYDLILRVVERTDRIGHVPRILYHWRAHGASAAGNPWAKPYAYEAGRRALEDHLTRRGLAGVVSSAGLGFYRVQYAISGSPRVTIIVPSRDNVERLGKCVGSIMEKTRYLSYEILIVDNRSRNEGTKAYYEKLRADPRVRLIWWDHEFNFSALNNYAVERTDSELLLFLNNDTEVVSGEWLDAMLEHGTRKEVGAVGAKLYYRDGRIQHGGVVLGDGGIARHAYRLRGRFEQGYMGRLHAVQNVSAVTGACMMVRREVFLAVGGFDEGFAVSLGDIDLCMKLRSNGYLVVWTPYAQLYHDESITRGSDEDLDKRMRAQREAELFVKKWGEALRKGDPYFPRGIQS